MEKTISSINLSASVCSLIAFIVLIFEKTNVFVFSFPKMIQYIIFSAYILMIGSLAIYTVMELSKMINANVLNVLLKIASFSFMVILIILFLIILVMLGDTFILGIRV